MSALQRPQNRLNPSDRYSKIDATRNIYQTFVIELIMFATSYKFELAPMQGAANQND
jgi:hypothetical protein